MSEHTTETVIANQRETIRRLIEERDELLANQQRLAEDRDHWWAEVDRLRSVLSRAIETAELEKVQQLTRELAEANRTIDLQSRQIAHQARQCQEIESERDAANQGWESLRHLFHLSLQERDAAREFNRRWRAARAVGDWENVAADYDATQTQQPQPTQVELVPWTAETRPRGPMTLRRRDRHWYEFTPAWEMDGDASGEYQISWKELCVEYEWSRDGKTWERCGTEVTR